MVLLKTTSQSSHSPIKFPKNVEGLQTLSSTLLENVQKWRDSNYQEMSYLREYSDLSSQASEDIKLDIDSETLTRINEIINDIISTDKKFVTDFGELNKQIKLLAQCPRFSLRNCSRKDIIAKAKTHFENATLNFYTLQEPQNELSAKLREFLNEVREPLYKILSLYIKRIDVSGIVKDGETVYSQYYGLYKNPPCSQKNSSKNIENLRLYFSEISLSKVYDIYLKKVLNFKSIEDRNDGEVMHINGIMAKLTKSTDIISEELSYLQEIINKKDRYNISKIEYYKLLQLVNAAHPALDILPEVYLNHVAHLLTNIIISEEQLMIYNLLEKILTNYSETPREG